jgi:hypothetical protein
LGVYYANLEAAEKATADENSGEAEKAGEAAETEKG